MIVAYYTKDKKYLQKDNYKKDFQANSIEELIGNIKIKDKVLIKAFSKDIIDFKFNSTIKGDFEFEILEELQPFDETVINQDIQALYNGVTSYIKYSVKPEWQDKLGKFVYLIKDNEEQRKIVEINNCFAFTPYDLSEVKESLEKYGDIRGAVLLRCFFNGKDVKEILSDIDEDWLRVYN